MNLQPWSNLYYPHFDTLNQVGGENLLLMLPIVSTLYPVGIVPYDAVAAFDSISSTLAAVKGSEK